MTIDDRLRLRRIQDRKRQRDAVSEKASPAARPAAAKSSRPAASNAKGASMAKRMSADQIYAERFARLGAVRKHALANLDLGFIDALKRCGVGRSSNERKRQRENSALAQIQLAAMQALSECDTCRGK